MTSQLREPVRRWIALLGVFFFAAVLAPAVEPAQSRGAQMTTSTVPVVPGKPIVLAHYYIWFDRSSWTRAKRDYPLAGRYSSDDVEVMRSHIVAAKSAGISGFIVSWKDTDTLTPRLRNLVKVCAEENFKLAVTYQGLTFDRVNVPTARIGTDLDVFIKEFAGNPVFDIFGKPLIVLTGTPGMTVAQVKTLRESRKNKILILATDKDVAGYERLADVVDGELYYWSSVNPARNRRYAQRLAEMGAAVRAHDGIWIAPVAPGFDARLVGGSSVVDRSDGATLQAEWNGAISSLPSAIGIISWNEFSEGTYIEPSEKYGNRYLKLVASMTGVPMPQLPDFDSSEPQGATTPVRGIAIAAGIVAMMTGLTVVAVRRRRTV